MYLNRNNIGKSWPVPRKGTKYLAVSSHNQNISIPLIVALRDVLKLVRTKKELKKVINEKQIKINGKQIRDTNYPLSLFDVLSITSLKKNYRVSLGKDKKTKFEEISDSEANKKTIKIIGKKLGKKGNLQLNLMDGRNVLTKEKAIVGDSVIFNFKENKIDKIIKMEKGNHGFVVKGKNSGIKGKIEEIVERGGKRLAVINNKSGESKDSETGKINVWIKNIIVME